MGAGSIGPRGEILRPSPWDSLARVSEGRTIRAASLHDAMRDQLEYLIDHVESQFCGCDICKRYWKVKAELLEPFD